MADTLGKRNILREAKSDYSPFTEIVKPAIDKGGDALVPLDDIALEKLKDSFQIEGLSLPGEYQSFLRQMNGFSYPGVTFFGVNYKPNESWKDLIIVNNDLRLDYPQQMKDRIIIAESFSFLFAINQSADEKNWYERLFHNLVIDQTFPTLVDLIKSTISVRDMLGNDTSCSNFARASLSPGFQ